MGSKLLSKANPKYTEPKGTEQIKHFKELVSSAISKEKKFRSLEKEAKQNKYLKGFYSGKYNGNLLYYIKGLKVLKMAIEGGLSAYSVYLDNNTKSDTDKKQLQKAIVRLSRTIIGKSIDLATDRLNDKYEETRDEYIFEQMCEFVNNGRNLVTEEKKVNGVVTQKTLSAEDMYSAIEKYANRIKTHDEDRLDAYTEIGSEVIAFVGAITQLARQSKTEAITYGALNIMNNAIRVSDLLIREKKGEILKEENIDKWDDVGTKEKAFLRMPPLNRQSVEKAKTDIVEARKKAIQSDAELIKNRKSDDIRGDMIFTAVLGCIIASEVKKNKENLSVNDLSKIVINAISKGKILKFGAKSIKEINKLSFFEMRYVEELEYALDMARQIESKNDELVSPEVNVRTVEFKDFRGEFYKTRIDGKDVPECVISIPQMKLESGQTVLLTGDSGCGKSTILRFLRDGDLENRKQIIVNGSEAVDKLGTDIVTFCEAKMNLHSQNIVEAITGKRKWSEVSREEKANLREIFYDLGFLNGDREQNKDFIRRCEYKDYDQFSTGQQKRLELAKALFEINDNSQVVLLDETVSNIQKDLGESAFRLIDKYTKKGKPKIVVMVSHDIESASKFADKRYHINQDRTVVEVPLRRKESAEGPMYGE